VAFTGVEFGEFTGIANSYLLKTIGSFRILFFFMQHPSHVSPWRRNFLRRAETQSETIQSGAR